MEIRKDLIGKKQARLFRAEDVKADANGVYEFSFSSEEPVERWFGREILSHDVEAADLARLNDGAPLLFNHNMDDYLGVVEKAWIGDDRRAYARVRFSQHPRAQQIKADVDDGILRNVSFMYEVDAYTADPKGEVYTAQKWKAYEVSFVTIPADQTVGVGRAEDMTREELKAKTVSQVGEESPVLNAAPVADFKGKQMENTPDAKTVRDDAIKAERERISTIQAMGERFKAQDLARQLIESGRSLDEARAAFLEKVGVEIKPVTGKDSDLGLSEKEVKNFSFLRALNALANPTDRSAWEAAGYERELSEAAAKKTGKTPQGILVPTDILRARAMQQRDLVVGTPTAGGNLVSTDLMSQSFIELLRNRSVAQRAGATVMNGLVGNVAIPRQSGAGTFYWVAESGAPTESQQTIDQVTMSPKTGGAYTDISRKLLLQSSIDVENMVRVDLATVCALGIDLAAFYGTAADNQPRGLANQAGINVVDLTAATPTFAEVVSMETAVAADNADIGTMAYLMGAAMRGSLKTTPKFGTGTEATIWEPGNTVNGYRTEVSNQIAPAEMFFGNFADLMIGFWSGLDLMVDPYSNSTSGTVRVVALQDVDIAIRHPESFAHAKIVP